MKHLYFVRHGLSEMNQRGIFSSQTDTPLVDEGREQAKQAAAKLRAVKIDLIVASPLSRTLETAQIIAAELGLDPAKIVTNDIFVERNFGDLEGQTYDAQAPINQTPGAEHSDDLVARVQTGLDWLRARPEDTILLVAHGAVGRALRHLLDPAAKPYHRQPRFANADPEQLL